MDRVSLVLDLNDVAGLLQFISTYCDSHPSKDREKELAEAVKENTDRLCAKYPSESEHIRKEILRFRKEVLK